MVCWFADYIKDITDGSIDPSIIEIVDMAFAECVNLEEIIIPNSIEKLGTMSQVQISV